MSETEADFDNAAATYTGSQFCPPDLSAEGCSGWVQGQVNGLASELQDIINDHVDWLNGVSVYPCFDGAWNADAAVISVYQATIQALEAQNLDLYQKNFTNAVASAFVKNVASYFSTCEVE
jgi:hypothetical protein